MYVRFPLSQGMSSRSTRVTYPPISAARGFDRAFPDALPETVDPCRECREFYILVTDPPCFVRHLAMERGEAVTRDGFVYADFELAK